MPVLTSPETARPIDTGLHKLSQSANHGRLWLGVAAAGLLIPGRTRRAAVRAIGALWATSFVVNAVLKPLTNRQRPLIDRTPVVRRLRRTPRTTSFPSGHAASAAAFATGAALELPTSASVLAPLAGAVGYSRVHVGVHHASDVVAGAALGAGIALATQYWWPVREVEPRVREPLPAPALPGGEGLLLVVNPRAGADNQDPRAAIARRLPGAEVIELDDGVNLEAELGNRAGTVRAVGVAGGDGTVARVAAAALAHRLPLAVFPAGTFNHFARDVGIESFEETAAAVEAGGGVAAEVAAVNGVPFVNTAVIGAYPELVRRREALKPAAGRWPATVLAAGQVLRGQRPLRLTIDGRAAEVWALFVGNCRYVKSPNAFPAGRPKLTDGLLDVGFLRADPPFSRARAVLAGLARVRERRHAAPRLPVTELTVVSRDGPVQVARDGEPGEHATVLRFAKLPNRLTVYAADGTRAGQEVA